MKVKKKTYHSSLQKELEIENKLNEYHKNNNSVLFFDIIKKDIINQKVLPHYFERCDVIYSEPSWEDGYDIFLKRAERQNTSNYLQYIDSINKIIETYESKKAIWLIIGSHIIRTIIKPDRILKVNLHGYKTNLLGWNDTNIYDSYENNFDFIELLSKNYNCIGDFCCGYGNSGKIFQTNDKNFVLSDFNKKCIFYIAKNLMGYRGNGYIE